ncbi:beta-hydroxyacyl-ACP dehydratase [Bacteroidales bacterium OttesenSCG-928-I21]|nr:beta-hydroxyacyl-ACP dehydratase [Bacteroidales bacterium OttesenSCG-928-I21]
MFKDNFFSIISRSETTNSTTFVVEFNAEHEIYKAHFPNNPITPGVCIIQVIKELFSDLKQKKFFIKQVKSVKFTSPINPLVTPKVSYQLDIEDTDEENSYHIKAITYADNTIFSKVNLLLVAEEL